MIKLSRQNEHFSRALFTVLLIIEITIFLLLIIFNRLVTHDTLFCLTSQYFFLNHAVTYKEFPLWIPYLTHGVTSSVLYTIQGCHGVLFDALLNIPSVLKNINFIHIYYFGIFAERILFLIGIWLLSKKLFTSQLTVFVVSLTALFSSIWMQQIYFNFHIYYAIPLILYFFHQFFDSKKWRYLIFSINLYCFQSLANVPYFVAITSLVIFFYILLFVCFNPNNLKEFSIKNPFSKSTPKKKKYLLFTGLTAILLTFIMFGAGYLSSFDNQVIFNFPHRNANGQVSIHQFLVYSMNTGGIFRWMELLLGFSWHREYTLYFGLLPILCIFLGIFCNFNKKSAPITILVLILFNISVGSILAAAFYHTWPLMKYYRHLSYVNPIIKLFLCLLAGFGLDVLFKKDQNRHNALQVKLAYIFISFLILGAAKYLFYVSQNPVQLRALAASMGFTVLGKNLINASVLIELAVKKMSVVAVIFFIYPFITQKRVQKAFLTILILLHVADIGLFFLKETTKRTTIIDEQGKSLFEFRQMPFQKRRNDHFLDSERAHSAYDSFLKDNHFIWTINAFLMQDEISTDRKTEYWLTHLNEYLLSFNESKDGKLLLDASNPTLQFPEDLSGVRKVSGVDEDKIQFFDQAFLLNDREKLKEIFGNKNFSGDILFVSTSRNDGEPLSENDMSLLNWTKEGSLSLNNRLHLPYTINEFNANKLVLSVNVLGEKKVWMMYSDVFHPKWQIKVNGKPQDIFRGNIAYKAIRLKPGHNIVDFRFKSTAISLFNRLVGINALLWVCYIICAIGRIYKYSDRTEKKDNSSF